MKIDIRGTITSNDTSWFYELFDVEHTTPAKIKDSLDDMGNDDKIELYINSPGGEVISGFEIYNMLVESGKYIQAFVESEAMSIASVIMCSADKITMRQGSMLLFHHAMVGACGGDANYYERILEDLKNVDDEIYEIYMNRFSNNDKFNPEQLMELINRGSFINSKKALEYGLIDEVTKKKFSLNEKKKQDKEAKAIVNSIYNVNVVDQKIIDKVKKLQLENEGLKNINKILKNERGKKWKI